MKDETLLAGGGGGESSPAEILGGTRPKVSDLDSFKSTGESSGPASRKSSPSGGKSGKGKGKIGRPTKNLAGFSAEKIDEVADDPDIEAARIEFEAALIELLVATTDGLADKNFILLCKKYPEAEARGLADKFRLTDKEKKHFGRLAIRLWRKYLGDQYLFTDESIAAVFAINYAMRNLEGFNQCRKIEAELNGKSTTQPTQKQSPIQSAAHPHSRSESNGQVNSGSSVDRHPSGPFGSNL